MKKTRILKSERFLEALLAPKDEFYVGLLLEDVLKSTNLEKYGIPPNLDVGDSFIPIPKRSATRANKYGKYVRKVPNEKTVKVVHISYWNKKGRHISFDRHFDVYVKELAHKFEIRLTCVKNEHGVKMLVSPKLLFSNTDETNVKNTHVMNLFLEIFQDFEVYTNKLEPALAFTHKYDFEVLPKGTMDMEDIVYLTEGARRFVRKEEEVKAYQKRLQILKEYDPEIVGKGTQGFWGYIVFGFEKSNVVLLESMYNQNATYVFDKKTFESLIAMNKQDVLTQRLAKKRFMHNKNWENRIRKFLRKMSA